MSESQTPVYGGCGRSIHSSGRSAQSSNRYTVLEGLRISQGGGKKIALPFVYVRHLLQYCACERFDVHGQKLVYVSYHKPTLLPFFISVKQNQQCRFLYEALLVGVSFLKSPVTVCGFAQWRISKH
jgi:hypothetical protein